MLRAPPASNLSSNLTPRASELPLLWRRPGWWTVRWRCACGVCAVCVRLLWDRTLEPALVRRRAARRGPLGLRGARAAGARHLDDEDVVRMHELEIHTPYSHACAF